jgi:hypothetical protein
MKDLRSVCSRADGARGYVAAIECSSVQVERPRASTSGGQSDGSVDTEAAAAAVPRPAAAAVVVGVLRVDFACEAQDLKELPELQVRQLRAGDSMSVNDR